MSRMAGNFTCMAAFGLMGLWIALLERHITMLWTKSLFVCFKITLQTVRFDKGTLGHAVHLAARQIDRVLQTHTERALGKWMQKELEMDEAILELCALDKLWSWCDNWVFVQYGSLVFVYLIYACVGSLLVAGVFMFFYTHCKPTHLGKLWIRICLTCAPLCACIAVSQYLTLTVWLGQGPINGYTSMRYGPGFFIALVLSLMTLAPLYLFEYLLNHEVAKKHGDDDIFLMNGAGIGPGYGANVGPGPGHGRGPLAPPPNGMQGYNPSPPQFGPPLSPRHGAMP
uniref:Uncharacterized protein n=1 Tax=Alexandrium andersonii TaxID=327968 RepID=A0A7S2AU48_9DINO